MPRRVVTLYRSQESMDASMDASYKPTGFRIKDILSDRHCDSSNNSSVISTSCAKKAPTDYKREFDSYKYAYNSILWLHLYWEGIRQYYQALHVGTKRNNFQFAKPSHFLAPWLYDGNFESDFRALDQIVNGSKGDKNLKTNISRKLPLDSPLFELEKLASTRLSTWNSEFSPLNSLLEKKTANQSRRRKSRTAFTAHQLSELEKVFRKQKYLTPSDRDRIANCLNLSSPQVITWFQNRRAKFKRDLEEMQNDILYAGKMKKKSNENASIGTDETESITENPCDGRTRNNDKIGFSAIET